MTSHLAIWQEWGLLKICKIFQAQKVSPLWPAFCSGCDHWEGRRRRRRGRCCGWSQSSRPYGQRPGSVSRPRRGRRDAKRPARSRYRRGRGASGCGTQGCDEVDRGQCDQMVRLFFNIWSFATKKFSPIMSQIGQSMLSILPNMKKPSIICQILVNFCQSGKILPNLFTLFMEDVSTLKEASFLSFVLSIQVTVHMK